MMCEAQVLELLYATFARLIALWRPGSPVAPSGVARPSVNARDGSWHELHDCVPLTDRRGSQNRWRPSSTLSCVIGLSAGTLGSGKPDGSSQRQVSGAA